MRNRAARHLWNLCRKAVAAAAMVASLSGCGQANSLDGSISELISLEFTKTRLSKQAAILTLDYLRSSESTLEEITLRLTLDTTGLELKDGMVIEDDAFDTAVRLQRATRANDQFPAMLSGALRFAAIEFRAGGNATGEFDISFVDGRLLLGEFDGPIKEQD